MVVPVPSWSCWSRDDSHLHRQRATATENTNITILESSFYAVSHLLRVFLNVPQNYSNLLLKQMLAVMTRLLQILF